MAYLQFLKTLAAVSGLIRFPFLMASVSSILMRESFFIR